MIHIRGSFGRKFCKGEAVILLCDQAVPQPRIGIVLDDKEPADYDYATSGPYAELGSPGVSVMWTNEFGVPYVSRHLRTVLASVHPVGVR